MFVRPGALVVRAAAGLAAVACLLASLAVGVRAGSASAQSRGPAGPRGPYLGQKPPGLTPELFAPGFVSTGLFERDVAMTPDGLEFYFSAGFRTITTIMVTRLRDGAWTAPEVASFATDPAYFNMEPCVSHDGRRIFFLTTRPRAGEAPKPGWGNNSIWVADRNGDGTWGEPYDLGPPVNGQDLTYFPSITRGGTLYFSRAKVEGKDSAIYRSRLVDGRYQEPERLPDTVNGGGLVFNAFVAPDESYLVAGVEGRQDSTPPGKANYCVFFRDAAGAWTAGINMGPAVNDPANTQLSPYVSPDGRFFFFSSNAPGEPAASSLKGLTHARLVELNSSPRNGSSDIFWVSAEIIERLRPGTKR
jgi:hypothetical protein